MRQGVMRASDTFVSTRETDLAPAVNCHNHVLEGFVLFPRPREDILAGICWCNPHHSSLRMRETLSLIYERTGLIMTHGGRRFPFFE